MTKPIRVNREKVKGWVKTYPTLKIAARELGVSTTCVLMLIRRYKVGRRISKRGFIVLFYGHLLGKINDRELEQLSGIQLGTIWIVRNQLGIPSASSRQRSVAAIAEYFVEQCKEKAYELLIQYGSIENYEAFKNQKPRNAELDKIVYGPSPVPDILARLKLLDAHRENMLRHIPEPWREPTREEIEERWPSK